MIKISLLISTLLFFMSFNTVDLDEVRCNYSKLLSNKALCQKMIAELAGTKNVSVTHLAYFGGVQTIWANHIFNPMAKLITFKEGKRSIEKAIKEEPSNV